MRCPRCGNENSDSNRFCGMCGGTLLPAPAPVPSVADRVAATGSSVPSSPALSAAGRAASAQPPIAPSPRSSTRVSEDAPVISGPSFLGLNDPGPRKAASLANDPHGSPAGNLDYLLEDEEEPSRGGGAKFVLILLALALAVGFGYLRWKSHGLPGLSSGTSKTPAVVQNPDGSDASSSSPPTSTTASTPPPNVAAAPTTPAAAQPTPDSTAHSSAPGGGSPATNPATESTPASAAPATNVPTPSPSSDAANSGGNSGATPATTPAPKDKDADAADPNSSPAASTKSSEPVEKPTPKPHAAIPRVAPTDNVTEAQKYIYGRGVTQDCERGMRLLKPAANQSNPKAMIEMGALYSAGLCTPHDLPTAYRWFALALRKDPDNLAVQTDLQKLWGEMTQPERQLAIKLSQ